MDAQPRRNFSLHIVLRDHYRAKNSHGWSLSPDATDLHTTACGINDLAVSLTEYRPDDVYKKVGVPGVPADPRKARHNQPHSTPLTTTNSQSLARLRTFRQSGLPKLQEEQNDLAYPALA